MKIEMDGLTYNILLVIIMSFCAYFISPWCFLLVIPFHAYRNPK